MATLPKVLINRADYQIGGGVALRLRTQVRVARLDDPKLLFRRPAPPPWGRSPLDFAAALGLVPCFTPVRSQESNGIAETFVKTFKRDTPSYD
jgi:transposase InsO family protein